VQYSDDPFPFSPAGRRDLAATLTKLHLFRLTQFDKVIFLDADTLVVRPISHLFQLAEPFAAAPDQGWPDAFNSGVLVATPSLDTFDALMDMMRSRGTWDGGDQGLLNDFFPDWHRLSFTYNVTPSAYYTCVPSRLAPSPSFSARADTRPPPCSYAPAYKRHGQDVSVLHFIGANKPWHRGSRKTYDPEAASKDYYGLVGQWYDVFERHYGTVSTWDVAGRVVVPPKSFLRKEFSSLPLLPAYSKASLESPQARSPTASSSASTPTISVKPPSPSRPVAISGSTRQPSPPHLTWDPARSSPPRDGPLQMRDAIPTTANMWDDGVPRSQQRARFEPPSAYPPPPSETHDWYKDVMRSKPDPSLIRPVFPWEQPAPTSPSSSSSAPVAPPAPTRTFSDEPPAAGAPSLRFAGSSNFSNAWDTVPGITRYAQQLAKRHVRRPSGGRSTSTGPPATTTTSGSSTVSGGGGGSSTSTSGTGSAEARPAHRRSRSASNVSAPRAGEAGLSSAPGGAEGGRAGGLYNKDGDASSRDGDDEDDDDAEVSTSSAATGGDAEDNDDAEVDSDEDVEGIDRITIKFRRALQAGELDPTNLQRGKKSGSPSSNEGGNDGTDTPSYYALPPKSPRDAPMVPSSPQKTRRDSRYVPTSPRQPRSPQAGLASNPLPFLGAPVASSSSSSSTSAAATAADLAARPPLRLQLPTTPGGTALSPRLAAQAIRNSTAARLTATGSGSGDGPPVVRATRVFSPETDTGVVKQQGLAALQRFVENMESMQQHQHQHQQGHYQG